MKLISQKSTLASKQKLAAIVIAVAIVLLAVAYFAVDYLVHLDTFADVDGTEYTVKRQDGAYALFDSNGYMLDTVVDNNITYYLTDLGTMVRVSDTGDASIYAVVDAENGESVSDYNRLMIYPRIQPANIKTIRIKNEHGSFVFERNKAGQMVIRGHENIAYDEQLASFLQSVCGNTTVVQKISSEALARYGFEEYGLDNPKGTLSVSTSDGVSHTLHIGKPLVSGGGYYVRLEGREAVYIFNNYIGNTALVPLETYVTPIILYPITATDYMFVHNFMVNTVTHNEDGSQTLTPDIALTYWDLSERQDTEYQSLPYKMTDPDMMMYTPSPDAVYAVMNGFLNMDFIGVKKLGVTNDALKQYGLDKPAKILYYEFHTKDEKGAPYYVKNHVYVSALTATGTYYVTSDVYGSSDQENYQRLAAYDHIVEVDRSMLPFMDWTTVDWVTKDYFQLNILVCDQLEFIAPDYHVTFDIKQVDANKDGKNDDILAYLVTDGNDKKLAANNFKTLYLNLLGGKLFGTAELDEAEIRAITSDPSRHLLTWKMRAITGTERTYSYYWLSESKALLSVDGNCEFYVLLSAAEKTVEDAINVANGYKITAVSPYTNIDK